MSEEKRTLEHIAMELGDIKRLLLIMARDAIRKDLEPIITTDERKRIWALCDGLNTTTEISQKAGITPRLVQMVVKELQNEDLVFVEKRGTPKRTFDYVPKTWRIKNV